MDKEKKNKRIKRSLMMAMLNKAIYRLPNGHEKNCAISVRNIANTLDLLDKKFPCENPDKCPEDLAKDAVEYTAQVLHGLQEFLRQHGIDPEGDT